MDRRNVTYFQDGYLSESQRARKYERWKNVIKELRKELRKQEDCPLHHRISKAKWSNEDMLVWNILAFFMIIFDNVWFNKVFHHPYWLSERLTTSFQNCQRVKPLLWYTHPILSMKKVEVRAAGKVMVQVELSEKRLIWTATKSLRYMSTC